ncbi:Zf-rvt domain-containing protein [Thalictrum thalictroides]|uniref:Zf-rvt domain-containing protein n=1 Tax=Thalictrum thalictroides TaxID=46969 RepID=A0A7J6W497_THATH|nr:Zf-rvt domain-containing protein [Thalictrum thalictroides]
MVFFKGEISSLLVVQNTLQIFAKATGLKINSQKTTLIAGGLNDQDSQLFADTMSIQLVKPPIQYLGLPLSSTTLSIKDCYPLVEGTTKRIQGWKNMFLSNARRVELVRSVLQSFHIYWARSFILPTTVLEQVSRICIKYIWSGPQMESKMHHASRETMFFSKKEGGLNLKDSVLWNKATYYGLVFKVASRDDSLWVKWVWAHHIQERSFWSTKIPFDCSWVWRNILQTRAIA